MSLILVFTQIVLLFYGTSFLPIGGKWDNVRFICYIVIIFVGFLASPHQFQLRKLRWLDLFAICGLVFAFFSFQYSINPRLTILRTLANLLIYLAIFWSLWGYCKNPNQAFKIIQSLILAWLVFYVVNFIFLVFRRESLFYLVESRDFSNMLDDPSGTYYSRYSGITGNPNGIGNFSAIILPVVFWNFKRKRNITNLFLLISTAFSFFYSFSRTAFICATIGISVYIWLSNRRNGAFIFICAVFLILLGIFSSDIFGVFLPKALVRPESLNFLGGRTEAWAASLDLIKNHPFRGYGFGTEEFLFSHFGYRFEIHSGTYTHNSFLGLAVQLGWIIAIGFYGVLIFFLISTFYKLLRFRSEYYSLMVALYASFLIGFFSTFFESWLYATGGIMAFPFFVFMMVIMRMLEFQSKSASMAVA